MRPVTILIPTYNRARALEAVWPSYLKCPLVEKIVVVDDGSSDSTPELLSRLVSGSPVEVQVITHPRKMGQQASRLSAIAAAQTEWVIFGEDDVWLTPDYIPTLLNQAKEFNAAAIAGRLLVGRVPGDFSPDLLQDDVASSSDAQVFDLANLEADFAAKPSSPVPAPYLHTIALIRRSVFDSVSFDTWFAGNGWREETDFYVSLNESGLGVYFTPDTACYHLRGPICASGGQRINRLAVEYYALRNTRYFAAKHWSYLKKQFGFTGTVDTWLAGFFARRTLRQLNRILRGDSRSSLKG